MKITPRIIAATRARVFPTDDKAIIVIAAIRKPDDTEYAKGRRTARAVCLFGANIFLFMVMVPRNESSAYLPSWPIDRMRRSLQTRRRRGRL
jgi:hypothetical protein